MIAVSVTYSEFKWVIFHGWVHVFKGTAKEVDQFLADNKDKYEEVE